ncbi:MAG TPA: DNA polymerase III subunit alpha [Caldisericia bacterium]|nr:DNA polymerase III subunit alpha [Caldisericia bacterium]HPL88901.1 DNA polymerase III subunit alpha [Caldisericia bacterium]HQG60083.1 DNA polymerase III subunit alpha [Caldisericia bacterium]HQH49488.1 DNA polymerase III subunit alpha [Caldisericia bacterium]HQJ44425.1 DNA polymerase III subunit alpha [Caldisericia bacterium]
MFVHLHNHSEFSLLDGAIKVYEMAARAAKLGMPAIALTDHGTMYGAIDFYKACTKQKIKPIMGCEFYVAPQNMESKETRSGMYHLVLLAENNKGYENIMRLVTEANIRGFYYKPRVDYDTLAKYSEGVLALTACISGEVPEKLLLDDEEGAKKALGTYKEIFNNRLWVELQDHGLKEEVSVMPKLIELAKNFELPVVATQDAHYLEHADAEAHDILLCIQTLSKQDDPDRMKFANDEFYLKTPGQMQELFKWIPEAVTNTLEIADRCNVTIELGKPHPPKFTDIGNDDPEAHKQFLWDLVNKGASWRFGCAISQDIRNRLDYEMRIIDQTGFVDYFLVVWDFIKYAKDHDVGVGPGRGSGAASLVSYCLNITDVNPLEYGLFFERFLNPDRISPPDFDIDFDDTKRDRVIKYVTQKYGEDSVAQVATFGRMEARGVIRDVGRALGFSYGDMDKIAKLIPFGAELEEALAGVPQLREIQQQNDQTKKLFEVAKRLEGVVRNFSTHAAGVVMADKPLYCYVPLQLDKEGKRVTQFEKNAVEELGILKVDFLGLRNISVINNACETIGKKTGEKLDIDKVPLDDQATYQTLQSGDTMGVFQLESSGMRRYLRELKPTVIQDIIAMVALYRPGPMEFIPQFIGGKHGEVVTKYLDPCLEPILEGTYGVAVYQEQVIQIARDFAGFTLGQGDILRKAVAKKIPELLAEQKRLFIERASQNGKNPQIAEEVFKFIEPFAGYGFNRAHSTCYGLLAYKTAYLKTHYKLEYYTAILTSYVGNEDRIKEMYEECRKSGLNVLPPDINKSEWTFEVEGEAIRYGLGALKNVGEVAVEAIIAERKSGGPFKNFEDFQKRCEGSKANKKVIESLIKAGVFDAFNEDRGHLLKKFSNGGGQMAFSLFAPQKQEEEPPTPKEEILAMEKEIMGFYMSDHPMRPYEKYIATIDHTDIAALGEVEEGSSIVILGIITSFRRAKSKKGNPISTCTLEDLTGICSITAFGKAYETLSDHLEDEGIVMIRGKVESKEGQPKIIAEEYIKTINTSDIQVSKGDETFVINVQVNLETQYHLLEKIKKLAMSKGNGQNPLVLFLAKGGQKIRMETDKECWIADHSVIPAFKELVGPNQVWLSKN